MNAYDIIGILLLLAAIFSYINVRMLKLPPTIGLMVVALVSSLFVLAIDRLSESWHLGGAITTFVQSVDFSETLMRGMLGLLLFAGALHTQLDALMDRRWAIGSLATVGILISTVLVAVAVFLIFRVLGIDVPFLHCLIFGALISPTDPIAVLGILKTAGAPKELESKIAGESLFNDGVGVVLFSVLVALAGFSGHGEMNAASIVEVFLVEAVGGVVLGFVLGFLAYKALKSIDDYNLELLITLALVTMIEFIARRLHTSGPLAVVVAGLLIGNQGRRFAMSEKTTLNVDRFWALLDGILNAVLFLLIGLEIFDLTLEGRYVLAGILAIGVVLGARFIAVFTPIRALGLFRSYATGTVRLLTWGGIRGGISVALALSLPSTGAMPSRDLILFCTYTVVVFSIVVQGLTIGKVVRVFQD